MLMPLRALPIGTLVARRITVIHFFGRMTRKTAMRVGGMVVQRLGRGRCQQIADNRADDRNPIRADHVNRVLDLCPSLAAPITAGPAEKVKCKCN